jgi:glutamate formiminotransferase/formiminotetrahydrofolate cyclodeaminase
VKTVECVPNFSEGRDHDTIEKIAHSIEGVRGVYLMDVSSGYDTNRTVYTFAGEPEAVLDGAWEAVKKGCELIDMRKHRGAHPRLGCCDVCPFVPVSGVKMDQCVELSGRLGERIGRELGLPVYLYGYAATVPGRKNLAIIREGEYEGLREKLKDLHWKPDFGPAEYNERVKRSGAIVTGAREFLIAYNLNLNSKRRETAKRIAEAIRESGSIRKDEKGNRVRVPGKLQFCKAIGWYVNKYNRAQVSINLTDYHKTNMHHAFEAAGEEAEKLGVEITGSEVVGLVPEKAIIESGLYFLRKQGKHKNISVKQIVDTAVQALGLDELEPFILEKKIIEYRISSEIER